MNKPAPFTLTGTSVPVAEQHPVGLRAVTIDWRRAYPCNQITVTERFTSVAATQNRLDQLRDTKSEPIHRVVDVCIEWADGVTHPVRYRLDAGRMLAEQVRRYFQVYAGEIGSLTPNEVNTILPSMLRERYSGMLVTHQLS